MAFALWIDEAEGIAWAKGTHEYRRFITPAELARMAREAGLTVTEFTGMTYNPITQHYTLGRDISVNYMVACRKPI